MKKTIIYALGCAVIIFGYKVMCFQMRKNLMRTQHQIDMEEAENRQRHMKEIINLTRQQDNNEHEKV